MSGGDPRALLADIVLTPELPHATGGGELRARLRSTKAAGGARARCVPRRRSCAAGYTARAGGADVRVAHRPVRPAARSHPERVKDGRPGRVDQPIRGAPACGPRAERSQPDVAAVIRVPRSPAGRRGPRAHVCARRHRGRHSAPARATSTTIRPASPTCSRGRARCSGRGRTARAAPRRSIRCRRRASVGAGRFDSRVYGYDYIPELDRLAVLVPRPWTGDAHGVRSGRGVLGPARLTSRHRRRCQEPRRASSRPSARPCSTRCRASTDLRAATRRRGQGEARRPPRARARARGQRRRRARGKVRHHLRRGPGVDVGRERAPVHGPHPDGLRLRPHAHRHVLRASAPVPRARPSRRRRPSTSMRTSRSTARPRAGRRSIPSPRRR